MAEVSITSAIVPLVSVVIGGALTLAGQWFLQRRQTDAQKRQRKAEKLEALIEALFQHKHWIERTRNIRVLRMEGMIEMSPMSKVQAITAAYFPQFTKDVYALDTAADKFELWMLSEGQKALTESGEGHDAAASPYFDHFHDLLERLRKYAMSELQ